MTGDNSSIGLTTARQFVAERATVFITGKRLEELERAVREIGKNVIGIQGDVSKGADLDRLFTQIQRMAGHLDVVVANAGSGTFVPFGSYTEEHLETTLAVHVKGTVFTVQKAIPLMPDGASVVIIGSISSVLGMPAFGVYSATKAALRSFVRTWSVDMKARGICFNIVSPGYAPTPGYEALGITAESLQPIVPRIPLGRLGTTQDIANAVAFFASQESSYITWSKLFVDSNIILI